MQSNPTQTVTINLIKECDFTPTITSDSTFADGMTYVAGNDPFTLTFAAGQTWSCAINNSLLTEDDTVVPFSTTSPFTLIVEPNYLDPFFEGTIDLRYVMTAI